MKTTMTGACGRAMAALAAVALSACAAVPPPKAHDAAWFQNRALRFAFFPPAVFEADLEPAVLQGHLEHEVAERNYGDPVMVRPLPGKTSWSDMDAVNAARESKCDAAVVCTIVAERDSYVADRDAKDAVSAPIPDRRDYAFRDGTGSARGPSVNATVRILRVADGAVVYEMTCTGTPADSESALASALLQWLQKVER